MKRPLAMLVLTLVIAGGLGWAYWVQRTKAQTNSDTKLQGRPIREWLQEIEIGASIQPNPAFEKLVAAGPAVVPDLSRVLLEPESLKDLSLRLPSAVVPLDKKYEKADLSEVLELKARAASVLGAIAYKYPAAPEVQAAVPSLISGLGNGSPVVRFLSAQALGAVGPLASNAVPALIVRTTDDDPSLRMCAVEAIGRIGLYSPDAIMAVTQALSDTNSDVRITATWVMQILQTNAPSRNARP